MSLLQSPERLPDSGLPSSVAPAIGSPVAHRVWRAARDRALSAVRAGGLVLVLGPPGTGKSLLLRELAHVLGEVGYDVLLQPRGDVPVEADAAAPDGAQDRSDGPPARLIASGEAPPDSSWFDPARAKPRVVLVDEAHRLDGAALERLGRLGARRVVLAGLSGDGGGLDRLPVRAAVVHLTSLPPDEVGAFAAAWLARDGRRTPPPDEHATRRLAECSGGVPRALDALLAAAASLAAADGAARIEASHIERAAATGEDGTVAAMPSPRADGDGAISATPPARPEPDDTRRRRAEADVQAHTPTIEQRPAVGHAVPARAIGPASRRLALGVSMCAAVGVAALYAWSPLRSDGPTRGKRPAPALPTTALAEPPGPGRVEVAPAPPEAASATPAAVVALEPSDPARPGTAAPPPEPSVAAPQPGAPATPGPPSPVAVEAVASTTPEAAAPAAVEPASSAAVEPGASAVSNPAAVAAVEPNPSTVPEPARVATAAVAPGTPAMPEPAAARVPERREPARGTPETATAGSGVSAAAVRSPPPARALPVGTPAHVAIYHPRDDARATARATDLARALRAAGMTVGEPVPAPQRGGKPGVRYFFAEDRDAAVAVLERAGLADEDMLPGGARPGVLPRPGSIEVTLPPG